MDGTRRDQPEPRGQAPRPSLDALPVPAITRRRLAVLVAGLVAIWLVGVFARQVGDASAAASKAEAMRQQNAAVESQIAALNAEVELSQTPAYVDQMARGYGLGGPKEVPFVVDPNAPPLASNAPGSEGIHEAEPEPQRSPLETWLRVLFGPDSGR